MRCDRLISLRLVQPLLNFLPNQDVPRIPVLMYHSVSDADEQRVPGYYRIATPPSVFAAQMELLKEEGYVSVSAANVLGDGAAAADHSRKVVVTFDDGYLDNLTAALPVLLRLGFTATVFLPTAFIGANRRSFNGRQCLSWQDVREMRQAGVVFGSHTVSHPKLVDLSQADLRRQLSDSKAAIEDQLGESVTLFAHPYAFPQERKGYVERLVDLLQELGYRWGFTTRIGRVSPEDPPYTLKRLPVNGLDDAALFGGKLIGAYDWLGGVQGVLRRRHLLHLTNARA